MISRWCAFGLMVVTLLISGCLVRLPEPGRYFTSEEIAQRLRNSIVKIEVVKRMPNQSNYTRSYGSGFVFKHGYVATNEHVIRHMQIKPSGVYITDSKRSYAIQRIIGYDVEYDIAIIQCSQLKAVPLSLGDSDKINIGETVYTAGSPKGYAGSFSSGVVSAMRDDAFKSSDDVIQFTAPISSGSSGSPLVNNKGQVIGVVRSQVTTGQNINFASPVNALRHLIQRSVAR